jgi:hypothetical protein
MDGVEMNAEYKNFLKIPPVLLLTRNCRYLVFRKSACAPTDSSRAVYSVVNLALQSTTLITLDLYLPRCINAEINVIDRLMQRGKYKSRVISVVLWSARFTTE